MKTERRHELQTNVLADWLGHKTEAIRPYFKLIVGGVVAIFLVAIVATIITNQQFEQSSRGWADFFAASSGDSPDRLRTVAEEHAGTLPAVWATQREADLELARGIRALYTNRGESIEALGAAKKLYVAVEDAAAGQPVLMQAAQFGSAQAYEAEGNVEKAIDYYEKAIESGKETSVGKEAQTRLERLKNKETAEFLAWFAKQIPVPRTAPGAGGFPGGDFGGPDVPGDLTELPGRPELSIPVPMSDPTDRAAPFSATNDPPAPTPPTDDKDGKKAEPAPDPEKPATTEPAEETPPVSEPETKSPEPATPEPATPEPATPEPATPEPSDTSPSEPTPSEPTPSEPTPSEPTEPPPAADAPAKDPAESSAADGAASE